VVFLDEPSSGIDLEGRELIRNTVSQLTTDGVAVILTTHDLDEGQRMADTVVIVDHGKVVANGTTEELLASGDGDEILFTAPTGLDTVAMSESLGFAVTTSGHGDYQAATAPTPQSVAALTNYLASNNVALGDLRAGRQRLDDVFRRLTSSTGDPAAATPDQRRGRDRRGRDRRRRKGGDPV